MSRTHAVRFLLIHLSLDGVGGGDPSASGGRGLVQDDLEGGRDRHADDRPDDAEQRPADQDAAMTVKPETFTAFPMIVGCRM